MVVPQPTGRSRWVAFAATYVTQTGCAVATQVVAPLAPLLQPELGLSNAQIGIFSSAVFAGSWGLLLVAGFVTDRFGLRSMMSLGQAMGGALMLAMVLVGSFGQAVAVMFAVGAGRATAMPGISKAVNDWFPRTTRGTAMGVIQTGVPVAGILTAATLPALALALGWRFAIAAAGCVLIAGGIFTAATYRDAPPSGRILGRRPTLRESLGEVVRNRSLWTISAISILFAMGQMASLTYLALYLKETVLASSFPDESTRIVAAGGYLALCQVGGAFGRVFWGVVSDRCFQGRRLVVLAMVGGIMAFLSLAMAGLALGGPLWLVSGIVFAYGATFVGWSGLYQTLVVEYAGRGYAATGVGLSMTLSQFGTVGGPPLFGFVVDLSGSYGQAWLFLGGLCVAGALVSASGARGEKRAAR